MKKDTEILKNKNIYICKTETKQNSKKYQGFQNKERKTG